MLYAVHAPWVWAKLLYTEGKNYRRDILYERHVRISDRKMSKKDNCLIKKDFSSYF